MKNAVHCGSFESEQYWREANLAALPSIPDANALAIVQAMDEMLFVFCGSGDILITRHGMNKGQYDYLQSLQYSFRTNLNPLTFDVREPGTTQHALNVFELLGRLNPGQEIDGLVPEGAVLEPFAVLPGTQEAVRRYKLLPTLPDEQTVRKVNTKTYSVSMRDRLLLPNIALIVHSIEELLQSGQQLLEKGPFLIKDEYGVSGKGNQLVDSDRVLRRIAGYLESSRNKDKRIRFVLEPLLDRETDFSCQFHIGSEGQITLLSVQQLVNHGFAFGESHSPEPSLLERLKRGNYDEIMHNIGRELYADGYYGDVCVDSMLLRDGSLAPLVEINARKSMSLIKHNVDRYLKQEDMHTCLIQVPLASAGEVSYEELLQRLEKAGILFSAGKGEGVIPLSSGTLQPPDKFRSAGSGKGKLYAALAYRNEDHKNRLSLKLDESLLRTGYTILR
ncbi:[Butirosin acyl-carrier protein]--L-glutamate ligase [compost metagenome]